MKSLILLLFVLVFLVGLQSVVILRQENLIESLSCYNDELRAYQSVITSQERYWRGKALE
jgi:hypothetical protein